MTVVTGQRPYVGPRPFQPGEDQIFHGREIEACALVSLIIAHPAVLLYSQSGAGKTSLLNAKVRKLLEERGAEVLGSARVSGSLPPDVSPTDIDNIFVYNGLMTLQPDTENRPFNGKTTFSDYFKSLPRGRRSEGGPLQRIVMFDQFEEIFTASQERWTERRTFFEQVATALEDDPHMCVVFAMREEYLASMDNYVSILPERLRTRFHLERLRSIAALEAVTRPLEGTSRRFADGVAEQLVENLLRVQVRTESGLETVTGEFVEPVQLQVVCQNLWDSLKDDVDLIDEKFIQSCGDVDRALTIYYENCLQTAVKQKEIKEGVLRRWFDTKLITPDGLRSIVYQEEHETATLPNPVVAQIEELRLVRAETRGGAYWYELTHDRFIAPIRASNRQWFAQQSALGRVLEEKAKKWEQQKLDEELLTSTQLDEVRRWIQSPEAEVFGVTESMKIYVQASKNAASKARNRMWRRVGIGLGVLSIAAMGMLGWALWERSKAAEARLIERSDVANTMLASGRHVDALIWAIKSVEPGLRNAGDPPWQSVESLRKVLKAAGGRLWRDNFAEKVQFQISPDGTLLVAYDNEQVWLKKLETGEVLAYKSIKIETPNAANTGQNRPQERVRTRERAYVYFTPKGGSLLFYEIADVQTRTEIWDFNLRPREPLNSLLKVNDATWFSPDEKALLIHRPGEILVVETATGNTATSIKTDGRNVVGLGVSPTGKELVGVFNDGTIVFRKLDSSSTSVITKGSVDQFQVEIQFSEDNKWVAISPSGFGMGSNRITVLDNQTGRIARTHETPSFMSAYCEFVPGSNKILIVEAQRLISPALEDGASNAEIWDFVADTATPIFTNSRAFLDDNGLFFLNSDLKTSPGTLQVIDPLTNKTLSVFIGLPDAEGLAISRDLKTAVTLDKNNLLQAWEPGDFNKKVDGLSNEELYAEACKRLRHNQLDYLQVAEICIPFLK